MENKELELNQENTEGEVTETETNKKKDVKQIVKKVLIGTGIAAIIGGVIAATRASSRHEMRYDEDDNPIYDHELKELESAENTVESTSEN